MTPFYFDTETFPIRPGRQAPRVVCVQSRSTRGDYLELREPGLDRVEAALRSGALMVAHSTAYDAACTIATRPSLLPLWFEAYSQDRVTCTLVREKLIRVAEGSSDRINSWGLLDTLNRYKIAHSFEDGDKDSPDAWRTRYAELDGIPVEQWPEAARRYALADLDISEVYKAQENFRALPDQFRQARADFWLYLQSASGMRTDPRAVEAFARKVEEEHEEHRARLRAAALVRSNGSKDTKRAAAHMREVCDAKGLSVKLTKTGKKLVKEGAEPDFEKYTALDAEQCRAVADPLLISYARYGSVGTLRSRVQRLQRAGSIPIQPRFDVLKKTGRTSSSMGAVKPGRPLLAFGDQVQNLNREPGLRECYTARPGHVLIAVDWSGAELHSLAQVCLWLGLSSELARTLNAGRDAHLWFACVRSGWDYEWAKGALAGHEGPEARKKVKGARQAAKAFNFGFPGGLGIETFRLFAALSYGVEMTEQEARDGKAEWIACYPEMTDYFAHINELIQSGAPLVHFKSERERGDLRYTAAANSYFQGHTADMAKAAGWTLAREYFGVDVGPLNDARPWNFIHDEHMAEAPEGVAHECQVRMSEIMETAGRVWCPDVPVRVEASIMRHWRKGAGPVYRDGRMIPYEDRDLDAGTERKIREALDSGTSAIQASWIFGIEEARCHTYKRAA